MKRLLHLSITILVINCIHAQSPMSGSQIINQSIEYHDPKGKLSSKSWTMEYEDDSHFKFDPKTYDFEVKRVIKGNDVVLKMKKENFIAEVNGSASFSNVEVEAKYTSKERGLMMRNYYHYLWTLPMKLKDDGTVIHDEVKTEDFYGKKSLQVKVTYTPEVGDDIWYFYFHPDTKSLQGYRFFHDESANDGEYILLDNTIEVSDVKIPQTRKWYTHKEDKFLGEDKLKKLKFN